MTEQIYDGLAQISNRIAQNCDFPGTQDVQAGLQAGRPPPFRTLQVTRFMPEFFPLSRNYFNHWGGHFVCAMRRGTRTRIFKSKLHSCRQSAVAVCTHASTPTVGFDSFCYFYWAFSATF